MRTLAAVLTAGFLCSCTHDPPPPPADFEWTRFTDSAAGYAMDVPDVYQANVEAGGSAVQFRWNGRVPVKVYLSSTEAAEERGLWPGHEPTGEITLAGVAGQRYDYDHCDGPSCSRMASFVIPWRGEWLALEFRSTRALHAVDQRIFDYFSLLPDDGPASPGPGEAGAATG